jgi:hypothetical protein
MVLIAGIYAVGSFTLPATRVGVMPPIQPVMAGHAGPVSA